MIDEFKADLKSLNCLQIYRKYILGGDCHLLNNHQMFEIRETICDKFEIEFNDVIMVGSGKLGFSIKPSRRFGVFNDDSDIDIAIVSTKLFERIWQEAYLFKKSGADWPSSSKFFKYLSEGWIRPDKLPPSSYFEFTADWWSFFNNLTSSNRFGQFKVRGGLYHSRLTRFSLRVILGVSVSSVLLISSQYCPQKSAHLLERLLRAIGFPLSTIQLIES